MQVHLGVETSLEALLIFFLVVVEITIEVWHLLICNITVLHAISKNDSLGCVEIHVLLVAVFSDSSNSTDSHGIFSRCGLAIERSTLQWCSHFVF